MGIYAPRDEGAAELPGPMRARASAPAVGCT